MRAETLSSHKVRISWNFASAFDGFYVGFREVNNQDLSQSRSTYSFRTIDLGKDPAGGSKSKYAFDVVIPDLRRNTRYGLIVQAFNRKGSGPASSEVTVQTAEYDAPSQLKVKAVTRDHQSLTLSWDEGGSSSSSSEDGNPVTGYVVNFKSTSENWEEVKVSGGKRSLFALENLRCGSKYQVTIAAYNAVGRSPASDLVTAATAGNRESTSAFASSSCSCPT